MRIRIIGCGMMGSAIAHTLAENGKKLFLYDQHEARAETLAHTLSATTCYSPLEGNTPDEILLLAFKPQDFQKSIAQFREFQGKLIVSILAGVTTAQIKEIFPHIPVARMIPNLAIQYGDGIVAFAETADLQPLKQEVEELFAPLGFVCWFSEEKCNAVTALTSSGPAFVFTLIEAMVDAAVAMGFTAQEGYELVKRMISGTLTTLYESNKLPGELKWQVTSPAGSTIAGLRTLEEKGVRSGIIETFLAACQRTQELGNPSYTMSQKF